MTDSFRVRFRLKMYLRVLSLIYPAALFPACLCYGLLTGAFFINESGAERDSAFFLIPIVLSVLVVAILLFGMVYLLVVTTIPMLVSRLDVTDQGLEYRYWPVYQIRCQWKDVASLTKRREITLVDTLLLNRAEELGWPVTMTIRRLLGMNTQYFIPLNTLEGWPDGRLAELLRQYVPHLFPE